MAASGPVPAAVASSMGDTPVPMLVIRILTGMPVLGVKAASAIFLMREDWNRELFTHTTRGSPVSSASPATLV